jgi:dipeptidase D
LSSLRGGNAHNAIPREARARLVLSGAARIGELRQALECEFEAIRTEFRRADPEMVYSVDQVEPPPGMWDEASAAKVLALIHGLPHGVLAMSQDMPGLVETSTNLAVVGESDGSFEIWTSTRSSIRSALEAARQSIRAMASLAGAEVTQDEGYPGWKPDLGSRLLAVVSRVHEERFGKPPRVGAVHAGLECGIIGEKYPGMDMISFGPQIEFPHSPDERVRVDSVGPFYELLRATLERLAGNASASAALTSPPRP